MSATCIRPKVDEDRCTLCGSCADVCPCQAITLGERGPVFSCPELCSAPEGCVAGSDAICLAEEICPEGAISRAIQITPG